MNRLKSILSFLLILAFVTLIGWLIWSLLFNRLPTVFNVTAQTERIEITTVNKNNSRLVLNDASIGSNDSIIYEKFEGSFELEQNVFVVIERIAYGPIFLTISCDSCDSVGKLYSGEDGSMIYKAADYIDFVISNVRTKAAEGLTHVFHIDGKIESGRNVTLELMDESNAVLRGGEIVLLGTSNNGTDYYQASSEKLRLGDRLVFEDQDSIGFGFVVINENPGMEAAYRVIGKVARIIRAGPQKEKTGIPISATFLDSLLHDKYFKGLSFLIGVLVFLITAFTFIMDAISFMKSDKKNTRKKKNKDD